MKTVDVFHNLVWSKYKGEVFSNLHQLADACARARFRFFQIAETDGERVSLGGVDLSYHRYPFRLLFKGSYGSIPKLQLIRVAFLEVWRSDADLVLLPCYDKPEYWAMLLAAMLRRRKRAVFVDSTIHDRPQVRWRGWLKRAFLKNVDGVFAYGSRARDYVVGHGADPARVFERCQAAALPHNYSPVEALSARIQRAAEPESPRFLYVGRLSPEKSIDTLLRSFVKVVESHPKSKLVIVGSGPQRDELEALCVSLGLANAVEFAGSKGIDDLAVEYSAATSLVLPSRSEPWGLVANEALSYGCPIVVSDRCGCVPELVVEGGTGFSFECGDVEDLSRKMCLAIVVFASTDSTAKQCMERIANYTPSTAARQILEGCMRILEATGGRQCKLS